MATAIALWRRLDAPGHDACRLVRSGPGWRIEGTAVFGERGRTALLDYRVECDGRWASLCGEVRGWLGTRAVDTRIARSARGRWMLNGIEVHGLEGCTDLDLGFTPATNTLAIRRLAAARQRAADAPAAWLDVFAGTLQALPQRYEMRGRDAWWYESPRFGYAALLPVTRAGFVRSYPGLWEMEGSKEGGHRAAAACTRRHPPGGASA